MRTFILILATIALATAIPAEDKIVAETTLVQAEATEEYDARAEAVAELELLQTKEGRSDAACRNLATGTLKEIDTSIRTQQSMLDRLYRGQRCHLEGKKAYDDSRTRKSHADRRLRDAQTRLRHAQNYQVDFGRYTFSGLRENNCRPFWNDRNYRTAKANYHRRVSEHRQRTADQRAAVESVKKFKAAHHAAVARCRCRVKDQHAKSWKTANRNNAQNAKAWTKAKHMLCVLSGTPQNRCNTRGLRTLRKPNLDRNVHRASCRRNVGRSFGAARKNRRVGRINTTRDFTVTADVYPTGTRNGWTNLFHFGNHNGERIPAVWFFSRTSRLHFRMARIGNQNDGCDPGQHLAQRRWTKVKGVLSGRSFRVYFNNRLVCTNNNYVSKLGGRGNIPVYVSDPWYPAAAAHVKNLAYNGRYVGSSEEEEEIQDEDME